MRIIYADALTELVLGKQGENEAQKIVFPKQLFQEFGDGEYGLIAQREGDENPYPCVITEDERNVYWIISSSDVAYAGYGNCELRLTIGDQIVKSITWTTKVFECMGESGKSPGPYESWVQEVLNAKAAIDNMSASASVDNNVGVPSVLVTKETIGDHNNFDFAFKNLKGIKGDKGDKGDTGDTGNGIESVTLNADYTLTIRYTSGQTVTTAPIRGEKGDTGNGISSITFNPDYSLTIHCTDGTSYTTSSIRGETGATGNGIASIVLNSNYTLTINYTDGTHYTTTSIRGEKGEKGDTGDTGEKGDTGDKGDTGNGIVSVVKTGTDGSVDTYTITFTNGTTTTFTVTNGSVTSVNGKTGAVTLTASDVEPNFTLLETITLEEDTNLISRTGYNYTDMIFRFKMPASTRPTETGQFNFGNDVVAWLPMIYRSNITYLINFRVKCEGGLMFCDYGATGSTTPQNLSDIPYRRPAGWLGAFALSKLTNFQFGIYSTTIPAGTEIKIYAR